MDARNNSLSCSSFGSESRGPGLQDGLPSSSIGETDLEVHPAGAASRFCEARRFIARTVRPTLAGWEQPNPLDCRPAG